MVPNSWKSKLTTTGLVLVVTPLVLQLFLAITLGILLYAEKQQTVRLDRYRRMEADVTELGKLMYDASQSLALALALRDRRLLEHYDQSAAELQTEVSSLLLLTQLDPVQSRAMRRLAVRTNDSLRELDALRTRVAESENPRLTELLDLSTAQRVIFESAGQFVSELHHFSAVVKAADQTSPYDAEKLRYLLYCVLAATGLVSLTFVALSVNFYRDITLRLSTVLTNTTKLAQGETLNARVGGIDEISLLDKAFHEAADALKLSAEQRKQLIGIVSHELRTPLTSIKVFFELLINGAYGAVSEALSTRATGADINLSRLIRLIDDLLDIEKMEAGKYEMNVRTVDAVAIFEKSVDAVEDFAAQKNMRLRSEPPDAYVVGDEDRLVQVLVNLLSNAIKYAPPESVVAVTSTQTKQTLEINVTDTGPGIPREARELIFNRFYQVSDRSCAAIKGTGLGLAICKTIVEQLGGQIGVRENPQGQGAVFWFTLPLASESELPILNAKTE